MNIFNTRRVGEVWSPVHWAERPKLRAAEGSWCFPIDGALLPEQNSDTWTLVSREKRKVLPGRQMSEHVQGPSRVEAELLLSSLQWERSEEFLPVQAAAVTCRLFNPMEWL